MRPVSQRWLDTLRGSHKAIFEVKVIEPYRVPATAAMFYATGTDPVGTPVPVEAGDVSWDIDSDIQATVSLVIPDASYYPSSPASLLAPYGNEVFVRRGLDYGGGAVEWVSLGYYRINSVEQDNARGGSFRVSGTDRMGRIIRDPVGSYQFNKAFYNNGQFVDQLVGEVYGADIFNVLNITIQWDDPVLKAKPLSRSIAITGGRWGALNDFILSLNKVWYFDYRGILVIRSPPSTSTPVWQVNGGQNGVVTSLGRSISDEGFANYVLVKGDGDVAASAVDGDITSPTWTGSKFGRYSREITENLVTDNAQATALADRDLGVSLALPYQVDFTAVPNPALEPYDTVQVSIPGGMDETHVIRQLTVPLSVTEPISAQTRRYR